jgi:hypothetical protein
MNYRELCSYFESEEKLEALLEKFSDIFEDINETASQFQQHMFKTEEEYAEVLDRMTGNYAKLVVISDMAQAYKEVIEDKNYLKIRNDAVDAGGKAPTADALKVMAHEKVANYIKVRNFLEANVKRADKSISTCQTQLKRIKKEIQREQVN